MKKIELCGLSSDMRRMSSLLPSIQFDQINLFSRLETLKALSCNNTIKPVSKLKAEDDAMEAFEDEKARELE